MNCQFSVHAKTGDAVEYIKPFGRVHGGLLQIGDVDLFPPNGDAEALEFYRSVEAAAQAGAMAMKARLLAARGDG